MGCVFARDVTIPGETLSVSNEGLKYGAFRSPLVSNGTGNEIGSLGVGFLETNASFVDLVIRPWLILTGHYGLVARGYGTPKNVKCSYVDVIQFAKSGHNSLGMRLAPTIRKIYRFFDVVPVSVDGMKPSKNGDANDMTKREVKFAFSNYSIFEESTASWVTSSEFF